MNNIIVAVYNGESFGAAVARVNRRKRNGNISNMLADARGLERWHIDVAWRPDLVADGPVTAVTTNVMERFASRSFSTSDSFARRYFSDLNGNRAVGEFFQGLPDYLN